MPTENSERKLEKNLRAEEVPRARDVEVTDPGIVLINAALRLGRGKVTRRQKERPAVWMLNLTKCESDMEWTVSAPAPNLECRGGLPVAVRDMAVAARIPGFLLRQCIVRVPIDSRVRDGLVLAEWHLSWGAQRKEAVLDMMVAAEVGLLIDFALE